MTPEEKSIYIKQLFENGTLKKKLGKNDIFKEPELLAEWKYGIRLARMVQSKVLQKLEHLCWRKEIVRFSGWNHAVKNGPTATWP